MENNFLLLVTIIDKGFTDLVMNAAREKGARGGTVLNARGTSNKEIEEKFKIVISSEKEVILILADVKIADDILKAINDAAGLHTKGRGIAFALPVEDVAGLKFN